MARIPAYPGFYITLRETGLVTVPTENPTDRLLIIAPAIDGPANVPIRVGSTAEAVRIFGPITYTDGYVNPVTNSSDGSWSGNHLVRAAALAFTNGATNVWLMRVGGAQARANEILTGTITGTYNIDIVALAPGSIYNSVTASASFASNTLTVTLNQPAQKGGTVTFTFPGSALLGDVLNSINSHPLNQTVVFMLSSGSPSGIAALTLPCSSMTFTSTSLNKSVTGTNGTRVAGESYATDVTGLYNALTDPVTGAFSQALESSFDVVVLDGIYGDDKIGNTADTSIYTKFAEFVYKASKNHPCHGVLGLRPIPHVDLSRIRNWVNNSYLSSTSGDLDAASRVIKFGYFIKEGSPYNDPDTGELIQLGRQVSVVAGIPAIMSAGPAGDFVDTPHVVYAARVSAEMPGKNFVYLPTPGIRDLVVRNFPSDLTRRLVEGVGSDPAAGTVGGGGYVVIRNLPYLGDRIAVVSDPTTSKRDHSYSTLTVARTVNAAVRLVKSAVAPFIGQPNRVEVHSAMATAIRGALNKLAEAGALLGGEGVGYQFSIIPFGADLQLGEIKVVLDLVPAISIRAVRIEVNVTL